MARWPRNITSHKQILLDTVLYGSVEQKKKHWRTKIFWAEKGNIIIPVEINIFTVLNKKRIKNKWSETPLTFNQKGPKGSWRPIGNHQNSSTPTKAHVADDTFN